MTNKLANMITRSTLSLIALCAIGFVVACEPATENTPTPAASPTSTATPVASPSPATSNSPSPSPEKKGKAAN